MPTFRYAQVERALARANGLPLTDEVMKTFRGRLRNLQKIGLSPAQPGKGRTILYAPRDLMFWAVCLELSQAGLPPSTVKEIMDAGIISDSAFVMTTVFVDKNEPIDKYLLIQPEFLSWHIEGQTAKRLSERDKQKRVVTIHTLEVLVSRGLSSRSILINLSATQRRMAAAIEDER